MLLRNRSRAVNKPTTLMADHTSHQPSPKPNQNNSNYARTNIIPSQFCTPKFRDFTMKCCLSEALPSPTSILDTRTLSSFGNNLFSSCEIATMTPRIQSERGIGLALDENCANKPSSGSVLFGTQLRVKNSTFSSHESKTCDADFETKKIKDSQKDGVGSSVLSLSEMELHEEYTRVISHGANPRTTHIFDNCIVESYYCSSPPMSNNQNTDCSASFLSLCHTCKKHLDQTKDIFIYRGDRAFCSQECRHQEMVLDGAENSEF